MLFIWLVLHCIKDVYSIKQVSTLSQYSSLTLCSSSSDTQRTQFVSDKNGVFISSEHEGADRKICLCVEDDNKVLRIQNLNANVASCDTHFNMQDNTPALYFNECHAMHRLQVMLLWTNTRYHFMSYIWLTYVSFYADNVILHCPTLSCVNNIQ
jgi:hypothetical protein